MSLTNSFKFRGNLVSDPELRDIVANNESIKKVNFRVAIHNGKSRAGTERPATFVDVEAFRGTAENVARFFHKGDEIWCEGELRMDSWTAQDGSKKNRLYVYLNSFEFGRPRRTPAGVQPAAAPVQQAPVQQAPARQPMPQPQPQPQSLDAAMNQAFSPDIPDMPDSDTGYTDNSGILM